MIRLMQYKNSYKVSLFVVLMVTCSLFTEAQNLRLGLHATPHITWFNSDVEDSDASSKLKFGFGLMSEFGFGQNYAFSTGITIIWKGGELAIRDTTGDYAVQYIEIPLTLKMKTREIGYFTYFARFGGALSFKIKEDVSFDPKLNPSQEINTYMTGVGASFIIGVGMEYSLGGNSSLIFGIDYNNSLIDNLKDDDPRIRKNESSTINQVTFSFGILF